MPAHPYDEIPALAGLATHEDAARIGFSVDENVARLQRFQWVERRLMATLVAHLTAEPVWEVKCALALHQWQGAEHVTALRTRIGEMRHPAPALDVAPDAALDRFLDELLHSRGTAELLAGVYQVAYSVLTDAYREHVARTNPLVDHPTRRLLRMALAETDEAVAWGTQALVAVLRADPAGRQEKDATAWGAHLRELLAAAGGIAGDRAPAGPLVPQPLRAAQPFVPDFHPRRDERFGGSYNFEFPPHVVYNAPGVPADERNLALVCKRALEMDVPEMMASFITERAGQPWEFHHDYSRQLWDEARHAMMGTVALQARGIDWKAELPLNVSFALRLNLHATALERQIMLYAIEQSLMPGETGKRFEYETAKAAGDALSAHFHDYDWADEVLHAQIGRRMLRRDGITRDEAIERAAAIHEKTWAALDAYRSREPQRNWWPAFVRRVLGHDGSDVRLGEERPRVITE
jgi:hypothetical protein